MSLTEVFLCMTISKENNIIKESSAERKVRFDPSIDFAQEAIRSARGHRARTKRLALERKNRVHQTARISAVVDILMKVTLSRRLHKLCRQHQDMGAFVDYFLDTVAEHYHGARVHSSNSDNASREQRCAYLRQLHQRHGCRLGDWTNREARNVLMVLSTDRRFAKEFHKELPGGLKSFRPGKKK